MASGKILVKSYNTHSGLDLKSNDLTRGPTFASAMKNAQYRKSGSIEKRPGYQTYASGAGPYGQFVYAKVNRTTGAEEPEVLSADSQLKKLLQSTISITYTGASPTAPVSIFYDVATAQYRCQIMEGATLVLDQALGLGFDEASPYTVNQLSTAINALANFATTLTGATTTPAAFIKTVVEWDLVSGDLDVMASYWSTVNTYYANQFAGSVTNQNSSEFENVSFVQVNNVVLMGNGYDEVLKYDGQNVYQAGLPKPDTATLALVAGAITGGPYSYRIQYIQWDAVGNLTESSLSDESAQVNPAAQNVQVTLENIVADYNINGAIVNGAQVTVTTITADNGSGGNQTLRVGDTAYFYDSVSAAYVEREVTAATNTSITIAGAAVTVADNAVISNNLRIAVWRNATAGPAITVWYLVAEIPNNAFAATQVYTDSTLDANLGAQLTPPFTDRGAIPKGKYMSVFRNQLVISGKFDEPNTVFYSDIESPEYFPALNQFDVNALTGDVITGLAPNNEVFAIFKNRSVHIVSGSIAENTFRVDQITSDIGCVAHHTIVEVRGILFFLSELGPRKIVGGQVPTALGPSSDNEMVSRIDPIFEQISLPADFQFSLKRATAANDRIKEKYVLFLPAESEEGGDVYANSNSAVYAYDYSRDAWLQWDNMNMAGGVVTLDNELYWIERRYSDFNSSVDSNFYRRHNNEDAFDYQDNNVPVNFSYAHQWEAVGEPSVMKKFLNIRVFSVEELQNNETNLTIKTEHNYTPDDYKSVLTMQFGGGGYGLSPYGTTPYGDPSIAAKKHKINSSRTRSLRVTFENNLDHENIIIAGFELEIATPYAPGFKS